MNLWTLTLRREDVLTAFEPAQTTSLPFEPTKIKESQFSAPPKGSVTLVWSDSPERVDRPPVIVVPHGELSDFLAWASTFLKQVKPFTAFSRVLDVADLESAHLLETPSIKGLEAALAGLIVSEALGGLSSAATHREISTFACESTFFFAFARALAVRLHAGRLERLHSDWSNLRSITNQPHREIATETVTLIQGVLLHLTGLANPNFVGKSAILPACQNLLKTGEISSDVWMSLVEAYPDLHFAPAEMRASRERRVLLLDKVMANESANQRDPLRIFALGYLLSLFDNGASINVQFLPPTAAWASILMWHGFTAGLQKENTIEAIGGGLGRRLTRDILQQEPLVASPRADIGLDELTVLHEARYSFDDIHAAAPNTLTVELAPRVYSIVRWPVRSKESHQGGVVTNRDSWRTQTQQKSLFHESEPSERQRLLSELGNVLERARNIQQRLSTMSFESDPSRRRTDRRKKD